MFKTKIYGTHWLFGTVQHCLTAVYRVLSFTDYVLAGLYVYDDNTSYATDMVIYDFCGMHIQKSTKFQSKAFKK